MGSGRVKDSKVNDASEGALHHIELWVPDLRRATTEWGWVLSTLGYTTYQTWPNGISWTKGPTYIVLEESPDLNGRHHQRTAPGLNHLAFLVANRLRVDALVKDGAEYGWTHSSLISIHTPVGASITPLTQRIQAAWK